MKVLDDSPRARLKRLVANPFFWLGGGAGALSTVSIPGAVAFFCFGVFLTLKR